MTVRNIASICNMVSNSLLFRVDIDPLAGTVLNLVVCVRVCVCDESPPTCTQRMCTLQGFFKKNEYTQ